MSNLNAREPLERVLRLLQEKPAAARNKNAPAIAVWAGDGVRCEIAGPAGEKAITDVPATFGGGNAGPNPGWLFRAGMASCLATTIAMRAAMLGIELQSLEVTAESEADTSRFFGISDASLAMIGLRMSIAIGAKGVGEGELRDLVAWCEARSTVACTVREHPEIAVDVTVV
jgi:uncharacterized OsmC-like protein